MRAQMCITSGFGTSMGESSTQVIQKLRGVIGSLQHPLMETMKAWPFGALSGRHQAIKFRTLWTVHS